MNVVFSDVGGLQKGNNVRYMGLNIGTVSSIEMENDSTILVSMVIQDQMLNHIKQNAIAHLGTDGLVGSMIVNVRPGEGNAPLIEPGEEIQSSTKIGTAEMLTTLHRTNENAALLTEDLLEITSSINGGQGFLATMLHDTIMARDIQQIIKNLKHASAVTNSMIGDFRELVQSVNLENSTAGVLLNDTLSAQQIRMVIHNLQSSSVDIMSMSHNLDSMSKKFSAGEGAVKYLATDTMLVRQLQHAILDVESGVRRFDENMEALKHNFLFRGYFRKLERQRSKRVAPE